MKIPKKLNEEGKVFGIPIVELGIVLAIPIAGTVIMNILGSFVSLPNSLHLVTLLIGIILYFILKRANKEGNPSFVSSWVSYNFLQPKKVIIKKPVGYERKTIRKAIEKAEEGI